MNVNKIAVRVYGAGLDLKYWNHIEGLVAGDKVVVEIRDEMAVAEVIEADYTGPYTPTKWVVQKVDLKVLEEVKTKIKEGREVVAKLQKRLDEQRNRLVFETLAKEDPDAAKLLERAKELGVL